MKFHNPYSSSSKKITRAVLFVCAIVFIFISLTLCQLLDDIARAANQYFILFSELLKNQFSNASAYMVNTNTPLMQCFSFMVGIYNGMLENVETNLERRRR